MLSFTAQFFSSTTSVLFTPSRGSLLGGDHIVAEIAHNFPSFRDKEDFAAVLHFETDGSRRSEQVPILRAAYHGNISRMLLKMPPAPCAGACDASLCISSDASPDTFCANFAYEPPTPRVISLKPGLGTVSGGSDMVVECSPWQISAENSRVDEDDTSKYFPEELPHVLFVNALGSSPATVVSLRVSDGVAFLKLISPASPGSAAGMARLMISFRGKQIECAYSFEYSSPTNEFAIELAPKEPFGVVGWKQQPLYVTVTTPLPDQTHGIIAHFGLTAATTFYTENQSSHMLVQYDPQVPSFALIPPLVSELPGHTGTAMEMVQVNFFSLDEHKAVVVNWSSCATFRFTYQSPVAVEACTFRGGQYHEIACQFNRPTNMVGNVVGEQSGQKQEHHCGTLFKPTFLATLNCNKEQCCSPGSCARCWWETDDILVVSLPHHSSVAPGTAMVFKGGLISVNGDHQRVSAASTSFASPLALPPTSVLLHDDPYYRLPVASVRGPSHVGSSQTELILDGSYSVGKGLQYTWRCPTDRQLDAALSAQAALGLSHTGPPADPGSQVLVMTEWLVSERMYNITLQVRDQAGHTSEKFTHDLIRFDAAIPTAIIEGPSRFSHPVPSSIVPGNLFNSSFVPLVLHGRALFPFKDAIPQLQYSWFGATLANNDSIPDGTVVSAIGNGPVLSFPYQRLIPGSRHLFRLVVTDTKQSAKGAPRQHSSGVAEVVVYAAPSYLFNQNVSTPRTTIPSGGRCSVNPSQGQAFFTKFRLFCHGFYSAYRTKPGVIEYSGDNHLRYNFRYRRQCSNAVLENNPQCRWHIISNENRRVVSNLFFPESRYGESDMFEVEAQIVDIRGADAFRWKTAVTVFNHQSIARTGNAAAARSKTSRHLLSIASHALPSGDIWSTLFSVAHWAKETEVTGSVVSVLSSKRPQHHSPDRMLKEQDTRSLAQSTASMMLNTYLAPIAAQTPIDVEAGTVAQLSNSLAAISGLSKDFAHEPADTSDFMVALGILDNLAEAYVSANKVKAVPMETVVATDLQTIMANLFTGDLLLRTARTYGATSPELRSVQDRMLSTFDKVHRSMRCWLLLESVADMPAVTIDAEGHSTGTARTVVQKVSRQNLAGTHFDVGEAAFTIDKDGQFGSLMTPEVVSVVAYTMPQPYASMQKNLPGEILGRDYPSIWHGPLAGIAFSSNKAPASLVSIPLQNITAAITLTIFAPINATTNRTNILPGHYASCRRWVYPLHPANKAITLAPRWLNAYSDGTGTVENIAVIKPETREPDGDVVTVTYGHHDSYLPLVPGYGRMVQCAIDPTGNVFTTNEFALLDTAAPPTPAPPTFAPTASPTQAPTPEPNLNWFLDFEGRTAYPRFTRLYKPPTRTTPLVEMLKTTDPPVLIEKYIRVDAYDGVYCPRHNVSATAESIGSIQSGGGTEHIPVCTPLVAEQVAAPVKTVTQLNQKYYSLFYDVPLQRPQTGTRVAVKYTIGVEMKGTTYDENKAYIINPGEPCFVRFMEIRTNAMLTYNYSLSMPFLGINLLIPPYGHTPTQFYGGRMSSPDHSKFHHDRYEEVDAENWSDGLGAWCSTVSYQDNSTGISTNHTHEWDPLPGHNATFTTCHFSPTLDEGGCPWKAPHY